MSFPKFSPIKLSLEQTRAKYFAKSSIDREIDIMLSDNFMSLFTLEEKTNNFQAWVYQ